MCHCCKSVGWTFDQANRAWLQEPSPQESMSQGGVFEALIAKELKLQKSLSQESLSQEEWLFKSI
jgi:hypothetical protein